jgi:ribosome maturation factor RimP
MEVQYLDDARAVLLLPRVFDWTDMSDVIINRVTAFAEELLPSMGLELVEVQFRREQHGWVLRLLIDAEEGITLDHCSKVSREVGVYLDVEDLIGHAYHLEVSSPGLERRLARITDFERFCGSKAKIRLHQAIDDEKVVVGEIVNVSGNDIEMEMENGKRVVISFDLISRARLAI